MENYHQMIKKILVAADASSSANRAVVMAAYLASKHDAELLILHVIRDMQLPAVLKKAPELEQFNHTREDILRQVANTILTEASELAKKEGAIKIQTAIGSGDPASSVVGFAKRRNIDTIVVGTRGLGKMKGLIMGSVSRKIADNAEANCIIVR
ncbi:MAG: nucleotide-binding universal stress UspA family protein [Gammaproteobacteria bacterium]|jgi:nucleotide-binding universal stress UspA family protein